MPLPLTVSPLMVLKGHIKGSLVVVFTQYCDDLALNFSEGMHYYFLFHKFATKSTMFPIISLSSYVYHLVYILLHSLSNLLVSL